MHSNILAFKNYQDEKKNVPPLSMMHASFSVVAQVKTGQIKGLVRKEMCLVGHTHLYTFYAWLLVMGKRCINVLYIFLSTIVISLPSSLQWSWTKLTSNTTRKINEYMPMWRYYSIGSVLVYFIILPIRLATTYPILKISYMEIL